jgi:hypothetical protein
MCEVAARRGEGTGGACAAAGLDVELPGQTPLVAAQLVGAAVELVHDVEQLVTPLRRCQAGQQGATGLQVQRDAVAGSDQFVGGLAHPVVREHDAVGEAVHQGGVDGQGQAGRHLLCRLRHQRGQQLRARLVAQAGRVLQQPEGLCRQPLQAPDHQLDHVAGDRLAVDARHVPAPAAAPRVEFEQALGLQFAEQLEHEERDAAGPGMHTFGQRRQLVRRPLQHAHQHLAHLLRLPGPEADVIDGHLGALQGLDQACGLRRKVAVVGEAGGHHQQRTQRRVGQHGLQQQAAAGVGGLQVVEHQHERRCRLGQQPQDLARHQVQVALGLQAVARRLRRRLAQQQAQRRQEAGRQRDVGTQRIVQASAPGHDLVLGAGQQLPQGCVERADEGRVRHILLLGVVAGLGVAAPARAHGLLQLPRQHRLAHARHTRDQQQPAAAALAHLLQRVEQAGEVGVAADQVLRRHQAAGQVLRTERKGWCPAVGVGIAQAAQQIGFQACAGLVAVLGCLGQQPGGDLFHHARHRGDSMAQRQGLSCQMAVNPFQRVSGVEGQPAGDQAVQQHAHGVQVGTCVQRTLRAAGLFGGEVGPGVAGVVAVGLAIARHRLFQRRRGTDRAGRAEVHQPQRRVGLVQQQVARLQVAMHQAALVQGRQSPQQADHQAHRRRPRQGLAAQGGHQRDRAGGAQHGGQALGAFQQGLRGTNAGALQGQRQRSLALQHRQVGKTRQLQQQRRGSPIDAGNGDAVRPCGRQPSLDMPVHAVHP